MALQVQIRCDIPNACDNGVCLFIAVTPQDYDHVVSRVIPFDRCDTCECTHIHIVNDLILEEDESFNISLTSHGQEIAVSPSRATIIVWDTDSKLNMIGG